MGRRSARGSKAGSARRVTVSSSPTFRSATAPVLAAVEKTYDDHFVVGYAKDDSDSSLETDDTKAWAQIVSPLAAFGCELEAVAVGFETFDVAIRDVNASTLGYPIADGMKIAAGLWREGDGPPPQRRALRRTP